MESRTLDRTLMRVRELLERDDVTSAIEIIESLLPPDQADVFEDLLPEQQDALLPELDVESAADILQELEDEDAAIVATRLNAGDLAGILDEMEPDEAADLLNDLSPEMAQATLDVMQDSAEVESLLEHEDDTSGGLMTTEFLAFPAGMQAREAPALVRAWEPRGPEFSYFFVIGAEGRLLGSVSALDLIRAESHDTMRSIMDTDVLFTTTDTPQEDVARLMARYDLSVVPVVDAEHHLVGVITVDDLVDVLEDEATEDVQRFGGSVPLGRPYLDTTILSSVGKRIGWLLLLFVTGTLTGTVMSRFSELLNSVIILSVFVPLLTGTGGNVGSQTTATIIRALAVGDIHTRDALAVLWRELRTSLLLGLLLALGGFLVALALWNSGIEVALVVGLAMLCIVVWSEFAGTLLPLLAVRVGIDAALVSGPLMSTVVDATGLLIYFSIASAVLQG